MAIRPYEHVADNRTVRVYPQADGSKTLWISNDDHGMTQLPGLVPVYRAAFKEETVYRIDGTHDTGTERNLIEVLIRGYNRVQVVERV